MSIHSPIRTLWHRFGPAPALSFNFLTGDIDGTDLDFARSSNATYLDSSGVLQTAANDTARFDHTIDGTARGLLIEGQRVFSSLHNRDLSNAAWTKTNTTAAKDATGVDGVANSASTLTATANNGTCLQALVLGSAKYTFGPWVKRKTGTGTIEVTVDGGVSWVDVTSELSTTQWARVQAFKSALANPSGGFRIGTSGDEIEVDFASVENGIFASSVVETGASPVTRQPDQATITLANIAFSATAGTVLLDFELYGIDTAVDQNFWAYSDTTADNRFFLFKRGSTEQTGGRITTLTAEQATFNGGGSNWTADDRRRLFYAWQSNDNVFIEDGTVVFTDGSVTLPTVTTGYIGANATGGVSHYGYWKAFSYWNKRRSNADGQRLTA